MSRDKRGVVNPVVVGSSPTATARLDNCPSVEVLRPSFVSRSADRLAVRAGFRGDRRGITLDQIGADTDSERASANELADVVERYAAGRDELDLRQRCLQRFQIRGAAERIRRKDLHSV